MIFPANRVFLIAEIAQAHDGSLGTAHAYIDAVARTGADAIKFQTHIADAESSPDEPWRVKFSPQDETRYGYWKRMEFTPAQWEGLAGHCEERGLIFLSSAFSIAACELLEKLGVPAWKVGAGETNNLPMIDWMASTGKPVILSSGMSPWTELNAAVDCVRRRGATASVLQCTTKYPCPPEELGLNVMAEIRQRYQCPTGLSDHSGTIYAGLAAAALGAQIIETHVAFSRECFGPDVSSSLTTQDLTRLVEGVRFIEKALANPMDKDAMAAQLAPARAIFGKSLVSLRDLPAGAVVSADDITSKKPGTGIAAARLREFIDRKLARAVVANQRFVEEDFE